MNEEIRFEVGEKYENMKGIFEVIAIHRDQMDIRWENGEEISTPIALQQRIIERMQHEREMEEEQLAQKKKGKPATAKAKKAFSGFEPGDFSHAISKTNWRGRGQLGGMVTRKLSSQSFKFNSWAVLRQPETHWLDMDRQKQVDLASQAKFYARVDDDHLFFGFHVPCPSNGSSDWSRLLIWLEKPENEDWLLKQCIANGLYLYDFSGKGFTGRLEVQDDRWAHFQEADSPVAVKSLSGFLADAAKAGEIDLRIEKRMHKQAAIDKKKAIADDLATLFSRLAPIYAAAAQGPSRS